MTRRREKRSLEKMDIVHTKSDTGAGWVGDDVKPATAVEKTKT